MDLLAAELLQEIGCLLGLRNEDGGAEQSGDLGQFAFPRLPMPQQILGVENALNIVDGLLEDWNSGMALLHHQLDHLAKRRADLNREDRGPRGHDLGNPLVAHFDDVLDHLALIVVDGTLPLSFGDRVQDFVASLFLGVLRPQPKGSRKDLPNALRHHGQRPNQLSQKAGRRQDQQERPFGS